MLLISRWNINKRHRLSKTECINVGWNHPEHLGGAVWQEIEGGMGVFSLLPTTLVNSEVWLKQATVHQRQAKIYWYILW